MHDHDMLDRESAVEQLLSLRDRVIETQPTVSVSLDRLEGRVLAKPAIAETDEPAYDHATMDGFAFAADDDYPLDVIGEVFAEDDPPAIQPGEAVRIATGARLPERADVVLKREEAEVDGDELRGPLLAAGTYVYERASNVRADETLFSAGERLSPKDALFLGDLGYEEVSVRERLSTGLLATGTEIHEGRWRDLDSAMLAGLFRAWGHEVTLEGSVPDDYEVVRDRIADLADAHDVVVTTGGTSVGDKDHVVRALDELGDVLFHRVSLRPGKPIAVAELPDAVAVAVPGKPVGAHTIVSLIARAFFTGEAALPTVPARLARDVGVGASGFEYAVPVTLSEGEAMPLGHVDSPLAVYRDTFDPSVLSSSTRASRADGFVLTETDLTAGGEVAVVPYPVVEWS